MRNPDRQLCEQSLLWSRERDESILKTATKMTVNGRWVEKPDGSGWQLLAAGLTYRYEENYARVGKEGRKGSFVLAEVEEEGAFEVTADMGRSSEEYLATK